MAVDKILEIDLSELTPESLKSIDGQIEKIIQSLKDTGQRAFDTTFPNVPQTQSQKQESFKKIFGRESFSTLVQVGANPLGFVTGQVAKLIPFIGTALLVTGVIAEFVRRVDAFQKEFVDRVDDRISIFRTKEQQALIQAGLQQLIITSAAGSAEPRDAYNTFQEFNTNQQRIETDFQIRNTSGVS